MDSAKVQIMDLEERISLERVEFKRVPVDEITDALSVPQPGTVLQKVTIVIILIQTHATTHHN